MNNNKMLKNPKQKRSRERVQLILDSTYCVLEEDGIKALSTNSIAAKAKIPVSSIYQYFSNKEEVLVAVYEDYLKTIRNTYSEVDTEENRQLPWRDFLTLVLQKLVAAETQSNIHNELETALGLYPKLLEVDHLHEEWMANRIVESLKHLGSTWSRPKLKRLAHFLYANNATIWTYRSKYKAPKKETFEWYLASFLAAAGKCFE